MPSFIRAFLAALCAWAMSQPATALPYVESGDAGELPATAQITRGSGALTTISGSLSFAHDRDMYAIRTGSPLRTFSALTAGLADPQLFLFTSAGLAFVADDDNGPGSQALLPSGNLSLTPSTPGLYYLAISAFNDDPYSSGSDRTARALPPRSASGWPARLSAVGPIRSP